jgi:tRNA pseudouridine38-40 synthase
MPRPGLASRLARATDVAARSTCGKCYAGRLRDHTYRLELAYEGTAFAGYARQPGQHTVEGCLLEALAPLVTPLPRLAVAGRTDKGVSALAQVVSFRVSAPLDLAELASRIDAAHPGALVLQDARVVPRWFHAQFSARARRYVYLLPDPDEAHDPVRVDRLLLALLGRRCFSAFARDTPPGKTTVRRLIEARARRAVHQGQAALRVDLLADAFLRKQVRVMVATALREAAAGAPDDALVTIAASADRTRSAPPAPAEGLVLVRAVF